MAKNAYVIRGYLHGSEQTHDGEVVEDMSADLFKQLEENHLVRKATDAEVTAARKKAKEPANKMARAPENKAAAEPAKK